jgi:hypothetical protein
MIQIKQRRFINLENPLFSTKSTQAKQYIPLTIRLFQVAFWKSLLENPFTLSYGRARTSDLQIPREHGNESLFPLSGSP